MTDTSETQQPDEDDGEPGLVLFVAVDDVPIEIVAATISPDYVVVFREDEPIAVVSDVELHRIVEAGAEQFGDVEHDGPDHRAVDRERPVDEFDFAVLRVRRDAGRFSVTGAGRTFRIAGDYQLNGKVGKHVRYRACRKFGHPNWFEGDFPGRPCQSLKPYPHPLD